MVFLVVGWVGPEIGHINRGPMQARTAGEESPDQIDLEPALKRPEQKVNPGYSGNEEDDLGKRHAVR
jgi:hypothetical protein